MTGLYPEPTAALGTGYGGDPHSRMHGRDLKVQENPLAFGAIGSGAVEDTEAVQEAIVAASEKGGGTVIIPAGYEFLVDELTPYSNVNIVGEGWSSILRLKSGSNAVAVIHSPYSEQPVDHVRIANLQIDGAKSTNTTASGIAFGGSNVVVEGCYIHSTAQGGINIGRPANGGKVRILNNWVHNPALTGNFWGGIACTGAEQVLIRGNIVTSNDTFMQYGIDVEPNPVWEVDRVLIADNIIVNGSLVVTASASGTIEQATITGNMVDASPNAGAGPGMKVEGVSGEVVVANNTVRGMTHTSPVLSLSTLTRPQIVGNRLTGMGPLQATYPDNVGILLDDVIGGLVAMNQIMADAATHVTEIAGISQTGTTTDVTFAINPMKNITVEGVTSGWDAGGPFNSDDGFNVSNNLFVDASRNVAAATLRAHDFTLLASLFPNLVRVADATNFEFNVGTGTKIGTATTEKLAFWNATPIVQPSANADTSGAILADLETEVNQLKATLRALGLMAT